MSPVRFERREKYPGFPTKTVITERSEGFQLWFPDVAKALNLSSQQLKELSEKLNVPK